MNPISTSKRYNIISFSSHGLSIRKIAFYTGLGKSAVAQVLQELEQEGPRLHGGHPSKLSDTNKQAIMQQIITGKTENAVQATKFINSIVNLSVSS